MTTSDRSLIGMLRSAFAGALLHFHVLADPAPASRPRINRRGGVHYSPSYARFYGACQKQLAEQHASAPALEGPLTAYVETIVTKPKTSKLPFPSGDVDNFAKGPLDAAKMARVVVDDKQILTLVSTKRWAEPGEEAGVILKIGRPDA